MNFVDGTGLLYKAVDDALTSSGLTVRWLPNGPLLTQDEIDSQIELGWQEHKAIFDVVLRRGLRPATAGILLENLARRERTLLISDRIAGRLEALAREFGVPYVDSAGNAWIPERDFLIDISGRRGAPSGGATTAGFTKTDLRVIMTYIVEPDAVRASARKLSERIGVSHGAAHQATTKLQRRGYLSSRGIRRGARLLDEWTEAYLARAGVHRTSRTMHASGGDGLAGQLGALPDAQISGELAAEALGWPIRGTSGILYAPSFAEVARKLHLQPQPGSTPVDVRIPGFVATDNPSGVAASILIRADMLASMEPRQIEVAQWAGEHDGNLRRLRDIP